SIVALNISQLENEGVISRLDFKASTTFFCVCASRLPHNCRGARSSAWAKNAASTKGCLPWLKLRKSGASGLVAFFIDSTASSIYFLRSFPSSVLSGPSSSQGAMPERSLPKASRCVLYALSFGTLASIGITFFSSFLLSAVKTGSAIFTNVWTKYALSPKPFAGSIRCAHSRCGTNKRASTIFLSCFIVFYFISNQVCRTTNLLSPVYITPTSVLSTFASTTARAPGEITCVTAAPSLTLIWIDSGLSVGFHTTDAILFIP